MVSGMTAHVTGHWRTDPRTGQRVWVDEHDRAATGGRSVATVPTATREALTAIADMQADIDAESRHDPIPPDEVLAGHLRELETHRAALARASAERDAAKDDWKQAVAECTRTEAPAAALQEQNAVLARSAHKAVLDLYRAYGVDDRMAGYLANDVIKDHSQRVGLPPAESLGDNRPVVVRPVENLKVKRGPLRAATLAAAEAADTHPDLQAANQALRANCIEWSARQPAIQAARQASIPLFARMGEANRTYEQAAHQVAKTERQVATLTLTAARNARFVAQNPGLPVPTTVDLDDATGQLIRRNPDGTTNAWVWRAGPNGDMDGTWMKVTGITPHSTGADTVNVLILEDGSTASRIDHYGGRSQSHHGATPLIALTDATEGSEPLSDETAITRFHGIIDTSG